MGAGGQGLWIFDCSIYRVDWHCEDSGKRGACGGDFVFRVQLQKLRLGEICGCNVEIEIALEGAFGQCRDKVLDIAPCRNSCFGNIEQRLCV